MPHSIPTHAHRDDHAATPALNGGLAPRPAPFNVASTERAEIEEYLAIHTDLALLLEPICARLRQAFGDCAELSLTLYSDPEQQDEYLILYVRLQKYEAGILQQIEVAVAPFMSQLEDASGHLLITTDFRHRRG